MVVSQRTPLVSKNPSISSQSLTTRRSSVYKAVNFEQQRVAACKVVSLTPETTAQDRKMLDKEIRVHSAMKHINVLEFLNAVIVESEAKTKYYPGIYMLLELASGGDLFDKIGA